MMESVLTKSSIGQALSHLLSCQCSSLIWACGLDYHKGTAGDKALHLRVNMSLGQPFGHILLIDL